MKATSFLGRQGLAFRGHNEKDDSLNKGNFVELVDVVGSSSSIEIQQKIQRRYGSYLSHDYQNDYINLFGNTIRKDLMKKVNDAGFFSILVDETKDASKKEQMCIILRYFDSKSNMIKERPLGTYHMRVLTAEALSKFIIRELNTLGIN